MAGSLEACPASPGGSHRYFIFKTGTEFVAATDDDKYGMLYAKQEYAVLGCNCGAVVKRTVVDRTE